MKINLICLPAFRLNKLKSYSPGEGHDYLILFIFHNPWHKILSEPARRQNKTG